MPSTNQRFKFFAFRLGHLLLKSRTLQVIKVWSKDGSVFDLPTSGFQRVAAIANDPDNSVRVNINLDDVRPIPPAAACAWSRLHRAVPRRSLSCRALLMSSA